MNDLIIGPVAEIVDGDTFDMRVERIGTHNKHSYNNTERIRLSNTNAAELGSPGGRDAKYALIRCLADQRVKCFVQSRDKYGRLVSEVKIIKEN